MAQPVRPLPREHTRAPPASLASQGRFTVSTYRVILAFACVHTVLEYCIRNNTVLHTDEGPILLRILTLTPTVLYAS